MAKNKNRGKINHQDLLQMHQYAFSFFSSKWRSADENARYLKAKHWTAEEEKKITKQGRLPYSMGLLAHKINTIVAAQKQGRTDFRVKSAVDPDDEIKAEIANLHLKQKEEETNFVHLESEVFEHGIGVLCGAAEVYTDVDKYGDNRVMVRRLDYNRVLWDTNSREYDLSDAAFIAKLEYKYRYELAEEYPGEKLHATTTGEAGSFVLQDPKVQSYFLQSDTHKGGSDYDLIALITHYQRTIRQYHYVVFPDPLNLWGTDNIVEKFQSKSDAKQFLGKLQMRYIAQHGILAPDAEIISKKEEAIDKYKFTYDRIIDYEKTNLEDFPITVYRSFFLADDFWTMTDVLKDPQKFLDRVFAQIDYGIGKDVKNLYQGNMRALAENETPETAKKKAEKTGGIIWAKTSDPVIQPVVGNRVNNQYFEIAGAMQAFLEDIAGGRSFQGLSEGSNESGRAILAKQQQGYLLSFLFIDNLNRWKKAVGEKILWHIREYEDTERTFRVLGKSLNKRITAYLESIGMYKPSITEEGMGYITVNKGGNNYLRNFEYELVVATSPLNETVREERLQQILAVSQLYPGAVPPTVLLEYMDVDETVKQQIQNAWQQQQEMAQQQQQQENNIQKAKIVSKLLPSGQSQNRQMQTQEIQRGQE